MSIRVANTGSSKSSIRNHGFRNSGLGFIEGLGFWMGFWVAGFRIGRRVLDSRCRARVLLGFWGSVLVLSTLRCRVPSRETLSPARGTASRA